MGGSKLNSKEALKILGVAGLVTSAVIFPNIGIAYSLISKEWKKYRNGDIGRIVKRFHKQKLLKLKELNNGQLILELSEKGKSRLLRYNFDDINLSKKRDGKMRLLIFDIPNKKKVSRDIFRKKLKELGFKKIQESVFISAYPCKEEIDFIINFLQISQYVMLIQVTKTEIGDEYSFQSRDKIMLEH